MSNDPRLATLATLEEVMHRNPFELVDSPWGTIEAWRASTLACGTMGALAQVAAIVRSDAAELEQKAVELDAKRSAVLSTINRLMKFMSRVDALTSRVEALEAKRKADEATAREFEEEPELPPDFDRPQDLPPSKIEDETHQPGGELHAIAAKEDSDLEDTPPPPEELDEPFAADQREFPDPELPKPPQVEQPVSISLNKA